MSASGLGVARPGSEPVQAGLDLDIRSGSALAVTGPNGAGKSTLGLTLGGLIPVSSGRLAASGLAAGLGADPFGWKSRELVTRIGSVFQDPEHQFVAATVRDELAVGARAIRLDPDESSRRIADLAERLRLTALLGANPFTLSGGEKRRLSVATALVTRPPLLIVDEPTFGQDSLTWAELVRLFLELLGDGGSIVAITHDEAFVDAVANERLALEVAA